MKLHEMVGDVRKCMIRLVISNRLMTMIIGEERRVGQAVCRHRIVIEEELESKEERPYYNCRPLMGAVVCEHL
jgi:hypothetical protein